MTVQDYIVFALICALTVFTVVALLDRRAFPYASVFVLNWMLTADFQARDWWIWMPYLDSATFWALLMCYFNRPYREGKIATAIGFVPLLCHFVYYGFAHNGVVYMYSLLALSVASMAVLASGNKDARSLVGVGLASVRRVFDNAPRPRHARGPVEE